MKEIENDILEGFLEESEILIGELNNTLDELEEGKREPHLLECFGQVIDRMMGTAQTLELDQISKFCELGKIIGYKSSQTIDNEKLTEVVVAVLFDTVDLLEKMIKNEVRGAECPLEGLNLDAFSKRLKWLSAKFKDVARGSCKIEEESNKLESQEDIDSLLDELGL